MTSDDVILRAQLGVRTLIARGLAVRAISWTSTLFLVALVRPEEFGLLAVIRGTLGLVDFISEFGFVGAMVRRARAPSDPEVAALIGLRLVVFVALFLIVLFVPNLFAPIGLGAPEWRGWLIAMFGSLLMTPWQLASRIQLERNLEFRRLATVEVSILALQSLGLVVAAIVGEFTAGIFVVMIASSLVATVLYQRLASGPAISLDLRPLRVVFGEAAGFSVSSAFHVFKDSFVPLLVASMFGLVAAGIWALALRIGQLHLLVFEAYWRSGFPAAAKLTSDVVALRRMSVAALTNAARLSYPLAGVLFSVAPLIAILLPNWASAVAQTQIYVLSFGLAGAFTAALAPAAVALRGPAAAAIENALSTGAIILVLLVLKLVELPTIALAYAAGNLASMLSLAAMTQPRVRPPLLTPVVRPLVSLGLVVSTYLGLRQVQPDAIVATLAACALSLVLAASDVRRLVELLFGRAHSTA